MFDIKVSGLDAWMNSLGSDLKGAINAELMAVALEGQDIIAPYPPAPATTKDRWYERGYGPRWRRKDGSVGGKKTSQTMGRRWSIASRGPLRIELRNSATYSAFVHDRKEQAKIHAATGWKTDADIEPELNRRGVITKAGKKLTSILEAK